MMNIHQIEFLKKEVILSSVKEPSTDMCMENVWVKVEKNKDGLSQWIVEKIGGQVTLFKVGDKILIKESLVQPLVFSGQGETNLFKVNEDLIDAKIKG